MTPVPTIGLFCIYRLPAFWVSAQDQQPFRKCLPPPIMTWALFQDAISLAGRLLPSMIPMTPSTPSTYGRVNYRGTHDDPHYAIRRLIDLLITISNAPTPDHVWDRVVQYLQQPEPATPIVSPPANRPLTPIPASVWHINP